MEMNKKQFPLDSKENCCVYLCRIISSCELCMDTLKTYNNQIKTDLEKYSQDALIPHDIYSEHTDKTYNVISYLINLLGDCQKTSISYFKYRKEISKRIKRGCLDIPLVEISQETAELMNEFNKMRNWLNHTPESLLISEMELVKEGKMCFPMDPVEIAHYDNVTYEYFEHLYLSNEEFYKNARQIIQVAKRDYSLLMGKSIAYPRVYLTKPLGVDKSEASKKSAKIQGLQSELDGE